MRFHKSGHQRVEPEAKRSLLVINFVVDADDPVLGFAVDWLEELRSRVDHLVVLTGRVGRVPPDLDVEIISTDWNPGQKLRNVLKFQRRLVGLLLLQRPDAVFTHMAAPQGLLASPFLRLLRIRHVLWYAHPQVSTTLRLAVACANSVVTSVPESFMLDSPKVKPIGQGIELSKFPRPAVEPRNLQTLVHWGRCDPVKRLDYLAATVETFGSQTGTESRLLAVGKPSTDTSSQWWQSVIDMDAERDRPVIDWIPGVNQSDLAHIAARSDGFVHASTTGFDKAALEAALLGLPVFSETESIRRQLDAPDCGNSILGQLHWWSSASSEQRIALCERQREAVIQRHSLSSLGDRLDQALFGGSAE